MRLGIDIGGSETKVLLKNRNFEFFDKSTLKTPHFRDEGDFFSFFSSVVSKYKLDEIRTINISIAGFYDALEDTLISTPNLKIKIKNVKKKLKEILKKEVYIENDVNAGAIYLLKTTDIKHFVLLLIGTGLGSGIISNGKLIKGHRGLGGEAGHMNYIPNGRLCGCGKMGCYESYCSGVAIKKMKEEGLKENEIIEIMRDALSHLLYNLTMLLNPEVIFLGGGVIWHYPLFEKLEKNFLFKVKVEKIEYDKFIGAKGVTLVEEFFND